MRCLLGDARRVRAFFTCLPDFRSNDLALASRLTNEDCVPPIFRGSAYTVEDFDYIASASEFLATNGRFPADAPRNVDLLRWRKGDLDRLALSLPSGLRGACPLLRFRLLPFRRLAEGLCVLENAMPSFGSDFCEVALAIVAI